LVFGDTRDGTWTSVRSLQLPEPTHCFSNYGSTWSISLINA